MAIPTWGANGTYSNGANVASLNVAVPAGTVNKSLILVSMMYYDGPTTITPPAGFAEALGSPMFFNYFGADLYRRVYWKRATGNDSGTYNFGLNSSTYIEGGAFRFSGVIDTGDPFDGSSSAAYPAQGNTFPAVSLTTTGDDRLLAWFGHLPSGPGFTPPSGFTTRYTGSAVGLATRDFPAAGSTGSLTGSYNTPGPSFAWLAALKPAPSGPPPGSSGFLALM